MTRPATRLPDFLYVGAAKSGSTWIWEILREHNEVFMSSAKEIFFFDRFYDRGLDWYAKFFEGVSNEIACGEISHDYFLKPEYAEAIARDLPAAKIVFCLREPIDRTWSEYLYDKTIFQFFPADRYQQGLNFLEFARAENVKHLSDYYTNVKPFYDLFPREQILTLFFDDLKQDPEDFARELFTFLGVNADFRPSSLHRRINVAREARIPWLAELAYKGGQLLRKIGRPDLLGAVKRQDWFEKVLYRPIQKNVASKSGFGADDAAALRPLYYGKVEELADLIGRPLPESWQRAGK